MPKAFKLRHVPPHGRQVAGDSQPSLTGFRILGPYRVLLEPTRRLALPMFVLFPDEGYASKNLGLLTYPRPPHALRYAEASRVPTWGSMVRFLTSFDSDLAGDNVPYLPRSAGAA